jgi:hypothetical protein
MVRSLWCSVLLLLLALAPGCVVRAGTDSVRLCPRFVRVTAASEISEDGRYMLVYGYKRIWRALSTRPYKNKLLAEPVFTLPEEAADVAPDTLRVPAAACIWKIHKVGEGYTLLSLAGGAAVAKGTGSSTDVALTSTPAKALLFQLSFAEGRLLLSAGDRNLRFSGYDDSYYGLYKASSSGYDDPYLYKVCYDTLLVSEDSLVSGPYVRTVSRSGSVMALSVSEQAASMADISDYRLQNGKVSADVPATVCAPSQGIFCFRGIAMRKVADACRALSYRRDDISDLAWRTTDSVDGLVYDYVSILPVEREAQSASADGGLTLEGGWSRVALQHLALSDTLAALNLTGAVLPQRMPQLAGANPNMVVLVSPLQSALFPATGLKVAVVGAGGPVATSAWELQDKYVFHTSENIRFAESQTPTYTRVMPDNAWQTLYLPFPVEEAPAGISLFVVDKVEGGNVLLRQVQRLDAYTPALFRWDGGAGLKVTFRTPALEIKPEPMPQEGVLAGTLSTLTTTADTPLMMLGSDGESFVEASEGSYVSPFRAFIRSGASALRIVWRPTAVTGVTMAGAEAPACDLLGRKVAAGSSGWRIVNRKLRINK